MSKAKKAAAPLTADQEARAAAVQRFKDIMSKCEEEAEELLVRIEQLRNDAVSQPTAFDWADVTRANDLLHRLQSAHSLTKQK